MYAFLFFKCSIYCGACNKFKSFSAFLVVYKAYNFDSNYLAIKVEKEVPFISRQCFQMAMADAMTVEWQRHFITISSSVRKKNCCFFLCFLYYDSFFRTSLVWPQNAAAHYGLCFCVVLLFFDAHTHNTELKTLNGY